jgi:enoyl-CoA hydratase/carnithine racemase
MSLVEISIDSKVKVADLFLNRPEKLNSFSPQLIKDFTEGLDSLVANPEVSCIVVSGRGRAFSTGYDMSVRDAPKDERPGANQSIVTAWQNAKQGIQTWLHVRDVPIPVIAAVHGYAFGAAQMLATNSDVCVVADDAIFGWAGVRGGGGWLGPAMAYYGHHRRAREMELRYGRFTGKQAWEIGWANYSVPAEEVLPLAHEIAEEIARTPRETLAIKKAAFNLVLDNMGYRQVIDAAAAWNTIAHRSEQSSVGDSHVDEVGLRAALREDADFRASRKLLNRVTGMNVPVPTARPPKKADPVAR